MIVDSSVLLAIFFKEKHATWAGDRLEQHKAHLKMSTVNLAEVLIQIRDREPTLFEQLRKTVFELPIQFIPPTVSQAEKVAKARLDFTSLNLGDCFVYALAIEESCPILTLDGDFKKCDAQVLMPE